MKEHIVAPAAAATACLLMLLALQLQAEPLSPQSLANRHFAETPSYATALAELNRAWPPGYPTLLWCATALGMPLGAVNPLLLLATLALLVPVTRRVAPGVHPAWGIALYAAGSFHAFNLHQLVSEALLIPLALCALLCALRCIDLDRLADRALLCATLAACCLTRYFALVWLLPAFGAAMVLQPADGGRAPLARRVGRAAGVVGIAVLPVALWMLHARLTTGYLTGMERFAPRGFSDKTSLTGNLLLTGQTVLLDWLAPGTDASHAAVGSGGTFDPLGLSLAATAIGLAGWCGATALRTPAPTGGRPGVLWWLLPALSVGYVVVLVVVWTLGNNDPIYSRFLYPSYVFFVLAGFHVHSHVKRAHPPGSAGRGGALLPFRLLYALLLASLGAGTLVSASRIWGTVS